MSGKYLDGVALAPLLDRLTDLEPMVMNEIRPLRALTYKGLLASVRREVEDLLNSRCPFPMYELADRPRSVMDYGAPDFSHLNPSAREDQKRIARALAETIEAFEPRLRDVYVEVDGLDQRQGRLLLKVHAILRVDRVNETISFPLAVSAASVR